MRRKGLEKKEEGVGSKSWVDILRALVTKRLKRVADHSRVHHSLRSGSTYPTQSTQPIQACEPSHHFLNLFSPLMSGFVSPKPS
ncbi:hypothetical protein GQ43DRAFT_219358 [Delitschia confertaspora ATCC 74209]|uniref:Uncharacterized protein n=1 Tax=Delitschia confertaspora ATCC 74209 TaxID=1513339 RepID=A0A9P4MLK6_9PLEO|nr:hypothetical protein GQ43DRAFT_219358 [Delitschia confertaspora ATCC 74209]